MFQLGIGVPMADDDEDDDALLAELAAIQGNPSPARKGKPKKGG